MFSFLDLPDGAESLVSGYCDASQRVIDGIVEHASSEIEEHFFRADEMVGGGISQNGGVYWLTDGTVNLTHEARRILAFEGGECFGFESLTGESYFSYDHDFAVQVQSISPSSFFALLERDAGISKAFLKLQLSYSRLLSAFLSTSPLLEQNFEPEVVKHEAGDAVLREGESGDEVFTLLNGSLEVTVEGVRVGDIREGEIFGVIAAFTGKKRTATVTALEESSVMKLPKSEFDQLVRQRPALISKLVETLSRSIVASNDQALQRNSGSV